jgi:hypothetical protein
VPPKPKDQDLQQSVGYTGATAMPTAITTFSMCFQLLTPQRQQRERKGVPASKINCEA